MSWTAPTGEQWLSCAQTSGGYLLRFPERADFFVAEEGREIVVLPVGETPPETLRHLLLDQVLPLVLNLRRREALHAAAVRIPGGVCAFIGPTGTGKSTLAASFLCAGYSAVSDDCLVVEESGPQVLAIPAYPGLRLWDDTLSALFANSNSSLAVAHYTTKRRPLLAESGRNFSGQARPLVRIYVLIRPEEVKEKSTEPLIEPLSAQAGFRELLSATFRLDITDRQMLERQFYFLERLVTRVPLRRVRIPNVFSSLPRVREAILADLAGTNADQL
jgi:hypothetical protein